MPLRIEFTGLISGDYSSPVSTTSTSNKSSVQFYSASSTNANFGVNYPDHYISKIDPDYVVSQFEANRPSASIPDANAMLIQSYSTRGKDFAPSIASTAEIGGTWGITYDRKRGLIYTSALVKRHAAMRDNDSDGKEDIGAIYVLTSTGSAMLWHDLSDLGIDFGLSLMPTISTRALPTTLTGPTHDPAMFPLVGKIGIGGIELSDDFSKMYVMNLYDKKIYTIDVENKSLLATSSAVPNPCNSGVGNVRPFALKYHRGKLYVGAICDAITSQNKNDLNAVVYSYDGTSFTSVLNFPLTYNKGYAFKDLDDNNGNGIKEEFGKQWNPWLDVMPPVIMAQSTADLLSYPQPMLVDLEFDVDESMIIVFNERAGHQLGYRNFGTNTSSNKLYSALVGGDILRAAPYR